MAYFYWKGISVEIKWKSTLWVMMSVVLRKPSILQLFRDRGTPVKKYKLEPLTGVLQFSVPIFVAPKLAIRI